MKTTNNKELCYCVTYEFNHRYYWQRVYGKDWKSVLSEVKRCFKNVHVIKVEWEEGNEGNKKNRQVCKLHKVNKKPRLGTVNKKVMVSICNFDKANKSSI